MSTSVLDAFAHAFDFAGGEIIHDDAIVGFKLGDEDLAHISQERNAIHRPVESKRGGKAAQA